MAFATLMLLLLYKLSTYWIADTMFKTGSDYSDTNPGKAYNYLHSATELNAGEPLYKSDLGYAAAEAAVVIAPDDATLSAQLKEDAITQTDKALSIGPKNTSLWRTAIRTYFQLTSIDPSFQQKTIDAIDKTISLAPTDAKLPFNKGLIYSQFGKDDLASLALEEAIKLKPNYHDAYLTIGDSYLKLGQKDKAIAAWNTVLKLAPGDPDATKKIAEVQQPGTSQLSVVKH